MTFWRRALSTGLGFFRNRPDGHAGALKELPLLLAHGAAVINQRAAFERERLDAPPLEDVQPPLPRQHPVAWEDHHSLWRGVGVVGARVAVLVVDGLLHDADRGTLPLLHETLDVGARFDPCEFLISSLELVLVAGQHLDLISSEREVARPAAAADYE
jgi:hypothetical protein